MSRVMFDRDYAGYVGIIVGYDEDDSYYVGMRDGSYFSGVEDTFKPSTSFEYIEGDKAKELLAAFLEYINENWDELKEET